MGMGGLSFLALAEDASPVCFFEGAGGGIIVRVLAGEPRDALAGALGKGVKKWKELSSVYEAHGDDHALVTATAPHVAVKLPDGVYKVHLGYVKTDTMHLELLRLRRNGDRPLAPVDASTTVDLTDAQLDAVDALIWVKGKAGTIVVRPQEAPADWDRGYSSGKQPTIEPSGGGRHVLVLPHAYAVAFWPAEDGGFFLAGEQGATDDGVAALLSIPDARFESTGLTLATGESGTMVLTTSGKDRVDATDRSIDFAPGEYDVAFTGSFTTAAAKLGFAARLRKIRRPQ